MPDLMTTTVKPVALIILDGWGVSQKTEANALALARLPFYNSLLRNCPWTLLSASGEDTGLPDNQMGNSEVGHMNLGAEVHVADFRVSHLVVGQPRVLAGRRQQGPGTIPKKRVVERQSCKGQGVGLRLLAHAPAVQDDQRDRFHGRGHEIRHCY